MFKTKITELFQIEYPIIKGGMLWLSTAELAAAVSSAGGLGIISAASFDTREKFQAELRKARTLTDKPIGVNLPLFPAIKPINIDEYIQTIADEGVTIVETAGRNPEPHMESLKKHGIKVMHKTTAVRYALKAESVGCDAVIIDGFECGGHPGEEDITSLVLIPLAASALKIPVIAAGGIGNGSGLAAALALGAEAVLMGTRFMLSREAPMHENIKKHLLGLQETDTVLILRSLGNSIRVIRNEVSEEILRLESNGAGIDEIIKLAQGTRGQEMMESGNISAGILACGQVIGLCNDIPSVKDLMQNIMREAAAASKRLQVQN
jgi:NADH:quinone reductase (non-electrogenic)